jgi:hypothetical protein
MHLLESAFRLGLLPPVRSMVITPEAEEAVALAVGMFSGRFSPSGLGFGCAGSILLLG